MQDRRRLLGAGLAAPLIATPGVVFAQTAPAPQPTPVPSAPVAGAPAYKPHSIRTPDGLQIAAYEYGNPAGPAILLIHGYAQCALSWARQLRDPALLREFRIVAYDARGHGMSDKPVGDQYYKPGKAWGDEVAAVIEQTQLNKPVLAGWSYGGRMMGDYLNAHGHAAIGGMNWVDATSSSADPTRYGRGGRFSGAATMGSPDLLVAIQNTVSFLHECFETQPTTGDFETMLAFNMMVPRHVRVAMQGRTADFDARLRALNIPVLVTHGEMDKLVDVSMGRFTAGIVPNARLSLYPHTGHAPFWEDAPRFNRELAELARSARA